MGPRGPKEAIPRDFLVEIDPKAWLAENHDRRGGPRSISSCAVEAPYQQKVESVGAPIMRHLEKVVMLQELDRHWREHLAAMDYLRQGIHLRAYAQKNPKQEYKREAFELFGALLERIKHDVISLSRLQLRNEAEIEAQERERERQMAHRLQMQHAEAVSPIQAAADAELRGSAGPGSRSGRQSRRVPGNRRSRPEPRRSPAAGRALRARRAEGVGRNEACPCGSGKKYKHCHGAGSRRTADQGGTGCL